MGSEERFHREAQELLIHSEAHLAALDLTYFEIANVVGVRRKQAEQAELLTEIITARCGDRLVRVDRELVERALAVAAEHNLTAYDAAYVAAARSNGWQLVSLDMRDLVSRGLAVTPDAAVYP